MPRLVWDASGEHLYETGVKHGVVYNINNAGQYPTGVVWNGLTAVTEKPTGGESNPQYADDQKYLDLTAAEDFEATIEAFTYPDEFAICNGFAELAPGVMVGQQARKPFGFAYETIIGNDTEGESYGRKIHLVYGAKASPSEKNYQSVNESPEATAFSFDLTTTPVNVTGHKPTAIITIDSTNADEDCLTKLEVALYGADEFDSAKTYAVGDTVLYGASTTKVPYVCKTAITTPGEWDASKWTELSVTAGPRLPLPDEVKTIMTPASVG